MQLRLFWNGYEWIECDVFIAWQIFNSWKFIVSSEFGLCSEKNHLEFDWTGLGKQQVWNFSSTFKHYIELQNVLRHQNWLVQNILNRILSKVKFKTFVTFGKFSKGRVNHFVGWGRKMEFNLFSCVDFFLWSQPINQKFSAVTKEMNGIFFLCEVTCKVQRDFSKGITLGFCWDLINLEKYLFRRINNFSQRW